MSDPRHDTLIAAGWTYDPRTNLYQEPGAGAWRNLDAAWDAYARANAPTQPKIADPRRSRPL